MISVLEQRPATGRDQQPNLAALCGKSADSSQTPNGSGTNHATIPSPQAIIAREWDHWDMARLASGDEEAMDSLIEQCHAKRLFAHLQRIVKSRTDAADLVQETFIRVFRHRADFKFELPFSTWLYAIGSNLAISLLRWRTRRPQTVPLPCETDEEPSIANDSLVDRSPTPREQLEKTEWTDALNEALARLPIQLRTPLLLVALEGLSQAEVAAQLGCTVKAVETRLYHCRKRLRLELQRLLNPRHVSTSMAAPAQRAHTKATRRRRTREGFCRDHRMQWAVAYEG